MTYTIKDNIVAVSTSVYWLPIDENTPRNVKVLAIHKNESGVAQQTFIKPNERWFTHWHPLPKFK